MPIQTGLETPLNKCCYIKADTFEEYKNKIIENFASCDLLQCHISEQLLMRFKESNGKKLIMTRPKFRELCRKEIYQRLVMNKILKKKGYDIENVEYTKDCTFTSVADVVEQCLKIFIQKQKELL